MPKSLVDTNGCEDRERKAGDEKKGTENRKVSKRDLGNRGKTGRDQFVSPSLLPPPSMAISDSIFFGSRSAKTTSQHLIQINLSLSRPPQKSGLSIIRLSAETPPFETNWQTKHRNNHHHRSHFSRLSLLFPRVFVFFLSSTFLFSFDGRVST